MALSLNLIGVWRPIRHPTEGALAAMRNIRPQTGQEAAAWIQPGFSVWEGLVFDALRVQRTKSSFVG